MTLFGDPGFGMPLLHRTLTRSPIWTRNASFIHTRPIGRTLSTPRSVLRVPARAFHPSQGLKVRNYYPRNNASSYSFMNRFRFFFDRIPGDWLVYGIMGTNVLIFFCFGVAETAFKNGDPQLLKWMYENFTSSAENIRQGRLWTLVTSAFAHQATDHLFMNTLGLWMFCPAVAQSLGSYAFLKVYLTGAIGCDLMSAYWNQNRFTRSMGASGALCAIMSFTACMSPRTSVALYGIIPMPLWAVVAGIFLYDLYGARSRGHVSTDFAGHIGGTLTGMGLFLVRRRLGIP